MVCLALWTLAFLPVNLADAVTVVGPPEFEDMEGNLSFNPSTPYPEERGFFPLGFREQGLYLAEYFASAGPGPFVITHWAARPDVSVNGPVLADYEYTLNLATTNVDSLTDNLVSNYGAGGTATTVFSGPVRFESDGIPSPGGLPHDFDYRITFDTLYMYDPSDGNLLVEIISPTEAGSQPIWRDADVFDTGPNLFALAKDTQSTTATSVGRAISIAQFTIIPEPSAAALSILGSVVLLAWRRPKPSAF
jgi:hypothetical protein